MTKRFLLGTSLGQFVLTKPTTLEDVLAVDADTITLETVTDGGDISQTTLNLKEVKIYWLYVVEKSKEVISKAVEKATKR